jgi:predicted RNase H-like nuclease (RuvC/YqgF family)
MRHGYGRRDFNIGSVSDAPSVVHLPHMAAKETTLTEVAEMLTHVVAHMATKEDVADIKTEMMEQFEQVDKQFHALDGRLRDMANEIAVIHRRVERLEELGASNAGFAKEIDHLLTRVAEIEKHLGIDKKIAA